MDALITDTLDYVESPVFVLEPGKHGEPIYAYMNACALRALNKLPTDILGLTAREIYPGRLGEAAFDQHCQAMRSGLYSAYEILLPVQGVQRLIRTTLRPEIDTEGRVIRIYGSSRDISGTRVFQEMQAEMQTISSEMEDFISLAAHDLRTPMRQVQTVTEMLLEDFEDLGDGKLELITLLAEMSEKAMRLIGDVLDHAQATQAVQNVVSFSFANLVSEIMTLLDPMKNCQVSYDDAVVLGDRTATQIVLRNLVDNALKYARPKADGTSLQLWIDICAAEGGMFRVSVRDNGNGFNDLSLLFLDEGKLRSGSGFGLFGVRRLVHARGGVMTASNCKHSCGAEISFELPGSVEAPRMAKRA